MKQALRSIVEICQTVTMQNHKDTALIKRVPVILEARQAISLPVAFTIITIVTDVGFALCTRVP